jgi:hypothetical protein
MSPDQHPSAKKLKHYVHSPSPSPTKARAKDLFRKPALGKSALLDAVQSSNRKRTGPSSPTHQPSQTGAIPGAVEEDDDVTYYDAYGPPLKNNGPYRTSATNPTLLASPAISTLNGT